MRSLQLALPKTMGCDAGLQELLDRERQPVPTQAMTRGDGRRWPGRYGCFYGIL